MVAIEPVITTRGHASNDAKAHSWIIRVVSIIIVLALWETVSRSGLLLKDAVPSCVEIAKALITQLSSSVLYMNLVVTMWGVVASLLIGGLLGTAAGIIFGTNRFLSAALEPFVVYLAPTPRIIFFPVMIMWFGVGIGSKIALGALSCFFTVAIVTAAGTRQINPVLIRVGHSFNASRAQMLFKVYLPAMRAPVLTGLRLGFGNAFISMLLAETKLSNQGLGFMIMQFYSRFELASLYALLIIAFVIAGAVNTVFGTLARE